MNEMAPSIHIEMVLPIPQYLSSRKYHPHTVENIINEIVEWQHSEFEI